MSLVSVPLCDPRAQYLNHKEEIDSALSRVLCKGNYVAGEEVEAFEEEWAKYCGAKYCVGVSSGTDALYLSLRAVRELNYQSNLKEDPITWTTPLTFFATTQAIIHAGIRPVFWDVSPFTGCLSVPRGTFSFGNGFYVPVHLYGYPADVLSKEVAITVEDSAHSHGQPLRGTVACFSFYPTKNLGGMGQSGAVVTDSEDIAKKVRTLRTHGEVKRFVHRYLSGNYRMDELQAAILRVKLPHVEEWNNRRRWIASIYRRGLREVEEVIKLQDHHSSHTYHAFVVKTFRRDSLAQYLRGNGVETAVRYPVPIHLQPALTYLGYHNGDFPHAEAWARENLNLPMYPELEQHQVEYVCERIKEWVGCE